MKTFKDLKIGDCIYETNKPRLLGFWIDKIEDISVNKYYTYFTCVDQDSKTIVIDVPNESVNDEIYLSRYKIYCTTLESFIDAISENI